MTRITSQAKSGAGAAAKKKEAVPTHDNSNWKKWTPEDCLLNMDVADESEDYTTEMLLAYIADNLDMLKKDSKHAVGIDPWDYISGSLENSVNDGDVDWSQYIKESSEETESNQQEIIEVSKEQVKAALKVLLTTRDEKIALLYEKHTEYNQTYFEGKLSNPVITIEKMDNRTLANYTYDGDPMAVNQHIRFNVNFIMLNEDWRILETLRHEMIHQWQDEVAYAKPEATDDELKTVSIPRIVPKSEPPEIVWEEVVQRRRPKETHNGDFRAYAVLVDIPAKGPNCTGNPAKMPEPQSYNHKFTCGCRASNGYPITIYSTRLDILEMYECQLCKLEGRSGKLVLMGKQRENAKTIHTKRSHIEKPGQDAIHDEMKEKFASFERFASKVLKDDFIDEIMTKGGVGTKFEQGVYQKGHNAFKDGSRYWVAYTLPKSPAKPSRKKPTPEAPKVEQEVPKPVEAQPEAPAAPVEPKAEAKVPKAEPKMPKAEPKMPKAEPKMPKAEPKMPKAEEPEKTPEETPKAPKKPRGKVVPFPAPEVPMAEEPKQEAPKAPAADDGFNPQTVIDAYVQAGSIRGAAKLLEMAYPTLQRRIEKYSIDFNAKTFKMPE